MKPADDGYDAAATAYARWALECAEWSMWADDDDALGWDLFEWDRWSEDTQ